jgi:hypothetical protein
MGANCFSAAAPVTRRVRAYFAPVNRATRTAVIFDPATEGKFGLNAPPPPWVSLGWIQGFARRSASKSAAVMTGIPRTTLEQVRELLDAEVGFEFLSWTKLTMALAAAAGATAQGMGAPAMPAVVVQAGSTATTIVLAAADAAKLATASMVAVDIDNTGQTGFVGSPVAGAYVRQPLSDVDYVRRVTFNVALVTQASATGLTLAEPLPGGVPPAGAKLQAVTGFVDREGGSFWQEWSGLFVMEGSQGERIVFYYPRLQAVGGAQEDAATLGGKGKGSLERVLLKAQFRALPVTDAVDGERVLCYRSFIPAAKALV